MGPKAIPRVQIKAIKIKQIRLYLVGVKRNKLHIILWFPVSIYRLMQLSLGWKSRYGDDDGQNEGFGNLKNAASERKTMTKTGSGFYVLFPFE